MPILSRTLVTYMLVRLEYIRVFGRLTGLSISMNQCVLPPLGMSLLLQARDVSRHDLLRRRLPPHADPLAVLRLGQKRSVNKQN